MKNGARVNLCKYCKTALSSLQDGFCSDNHKILHTKKQLKKNPGSTKDLILVRIDSKTVVYAKNKSEISTILEKYKDNGLEKHKGEFYGTRPKASAPLKRRKSTNPMI